jgi:hypothetical protein
MRTFKVDIKIKERIIVFVSSFVLFGATYYGHSITTHRLEVLKHGTTVTCKVTRTTRKRSNKTFYVTIDNTELDGGENFGQYKDLNVGDIVEVRYMPNIHYVVAQGVKGYRNMVIFQYIMFIVSVILFILPIIYPALNRMNPKVFKWT